MKSHLAEIVIRNIEFFGLAPDSEVHPDAAVRQLEIVSTLLKQLSESELDDFRIQVQERLKELDRRRASEEQIEFLRDIEENLGLGAGRSQQ